jgi:hypothetical protein
LQQKAEPLVAIARALREKALAALGAAGANWTENRLRIAAMKNADDAAETAASAQRDAFAAAATAAAAKADLSDVRTRIARLNERARVLSATGSVGTNMAMMQGGDIAGR